VTVYGIDCLDQRSAAMAWLEQFGDPKTLFDEGGRVNDASLEQEAAMSTPTERFATYEDLCRVLDQKLA
jgi:hypothetical protein